MSETAAIEDRLLTYNERQPDHALWRLNILEDVIEASAEITSLRAQLEASNRRVAKLEARLEIDHEWQIAGDKDEPQRVEIPPENRDDEIDGIEARDETIKLQDKSLAALRAQLEEARRKAIEECALRAREVVDANRGLYSLAPDMSWTHDQIADEFERLEKSIRALLTESNT